MFITQSKAIKFVSAALVAAALHGCASTPAPSLPIVDTRSAVQVLAQKRQDVAFGQVLYNYFQGAPDQTLLQDALTRLNEQAANKPYSLENQDRLDLMKAAVSLQLGMTQQAERIFTRLLAQSADPYIQANTWFWLAKSSFAQKQVGVSERAYTTIIEDDLQEHLSDAHWEELVYQVSYERMNNGGDWQALAAILPSDSIYQTYLIANQAVIAHNRQDFEAANNAFVTAKLTLDDTPIENAIHEEKINTSWWSWFNWFDNGLTESQETRAFQERNALFDRLNYGLGVSLLEQKDYANALVALKLIGRESLHAEQALLTYGWTLAQENRWPLAMAAWQYLRDNSQGIYALQASHGLAFAYEQQGALAEAFYALRDSSRQLDTAIMSLRKFEEKVQQVNFFDTVEDDDWPIQHRDLQILLLSGDAETDSAYLLEVRSQAKQLLNTLDDNLAQIDSMYRLLDEREQAFDRRVDSLSLTSAKSILDSTEDRIADVEAVLNSEPLSARLFANTAQAAALERLQKAEQRIARINIERERKLSAKYAQRVQRLQGIVAWELSQAFPDMRWQHQKQLNNLAAVYADVNTQYQALVKLQSNANMIQQHRSRVDAMALSAQQNYVRTKRLVDSLSKRLTEFLQANMALRMQALSNQQVATRLAMIRLQDLTQPARGQ